MQKMSGFQQVNVPYPEWRLVNYGEISTFAPVRPT